VAARGASAEQVLAEAGLQPSALEDGDRLLDLEEVLRLTDAAARATGDDAFGLHLGLAWDLGGGLGLLSYAVLNAPTVATALRNFERYGRVHIQGGRIGLEHEGREALLFYDLGFTDHELARQHVEGSAVVGLRILRQLVGPQFRLLRVHFAHRRPRDVSEHARIFGAPLRFEQRFDTALAFPAADLERAVVGADRRLLPIVERHLEELLSLGKGGAWLEQVRVAIARALCDGPPDIGSIAKQLGMSVRTLQRRLDEHGKAYKELVGEVRRDLARRYLADRDTSLTEVAFLLGYSELSAFDRAFRRWTGSTPLAVRRSLREPAARS
jgi:AraC-like DNA-binding protein